MDIRHSFTFIDTTLRDGLQRPGLSFPLHRKLEMLNDLVQCGFKTLEAGIPVMGDVECHWLREALKVHRNITGWCRARREDIDAAADCGLDHISVSFPVSERSQKITGFTSSKLFRRMEELLPSALTDFSTVSVGAMDASRASAAELRDFIVLALDLGAKRVRLADTVGILSPMDILKWAELFNPWLSRLEFHGHNDLGMATACSVTAFEAGFGAVSGTLCGWGERAGNMAWEEFLGALEVKGYSLGDMDVPGVLHLASQWSRSVEPFPKTKPFLGELTRKHASGIHIAGLMKDSLSFMPYNPEKLGLPGNSFVSSRLNGKAAKQFLSHKKTLKEAIS